MRNTFNASVDYLDAAPHLGGICYVSPKYMEDNQDDVYPRGT